jgi:hypothetical protein
MGKMTTDPPPSGIHKSERLHHKKNKNYLMNHERWADENKSSIASINQRDYIQTIKT